jgi:hypothetical protein
MQRRNNYAWPLILTLFTYVYGVVEDSSLSGRLDLFRTGLIDRGNILLETLFTVVSRLALEF